VRFLAPVGGYIPDGFGVLASPAHRGVPAGVLAGLVWAGDNGAFTNGFKPFKFFPWLEKMSPYRDTCLFIAVPDVLGDAIQTLDNYRHWVRLLEGWPVAFVAQDGQENLPFPNYFDALFVGGSTEWKTGPGARECVERAQALHKHIHIGRVNWRRRYKLFSDMPGSRVFTCDGTRTRYDGKAKALAAWTEYMENSGTVSSGDCSGKHYSSNLGSGGERTERLSPGWIQPNLQGYTA